MRGRIDHRNTEIEEEPIYLPSDKMNSCSQPARRTSEGWQSSGLGVNAHASAAINLRTPKTPPRGSDRAQTRSVFKDIRPGAVIKNLTAVRVPRETPKNS